MVREGFAAEGYRMTEEQILSPHRRRDLSYARHMIAFFLRQYNGMTLQRVANTLNRNHATVIYYDAHYVDLVETQGWMGRMYVEACRVMDLKMPEWIKVQINDNVFRPIKAKKVKKAYPSRSRNLVEGDGHYAKPMNWSPEERESLRKLRQSNFEGVGLGNASSRRHRA